MAEKFLLLCEYTLNFTSGLQLLLKQQLALYNWSEYTAKLRSALCLIAHPVILAKPCCFKEHSLHNQGLLVFLRFVVRCLVGACNSY